MKHTYLLCPSSLQESLELPRAIKRQIQKQVNTEGNKKIFSTKIRFETEAQGNTEMD